MEIPETGKTMMPDKESGCVKTRFTVPSLLPRLMLIIPSGRTKTGTINSIGLDFPDGETRLTVRRRGEARPCHGARPEKLAVTSGGSE